MLAFTMAVVALSGCGRLGFDLTEPDVEDSVQSPGQPDESQPDAAPPTPTPGTDAGMVFGDTDASADGAVPPQPDARCPGNGFICDSFDEELTFWLTDHHGGNAVIQKEKVRIGTGAVEFTAPGADSHGRLYTDLTEPLSGGPLYVRFQLLVPAEVLIDDYLVIFEWKRDDSKVSLDMVGDLFQLYIGGADTVLQGGVPRDRWACVVLSANVEEQGSLSLFVDDSPISTIRGDTLPDNGLERFYLSALTGPAQTSAVQIFVDEFVASNNPLSCH